MLLAQSASASSSITMIIAYVILFGAIIYFMTCLLYTSELPTKLEV